MGYKKIIIALISLLILSGCQGSKPGNSVLPQAYEDVKESLTLMDERCSIYESALEVVAAYAENPGSEALEAAQEACAGAIAGIDAMPLPQSALTPEERNGLIQAGLNMADYDVLFQYADYYKNENIHTLDMLAYYLSHAPLMDDILVYTVDFQIRYQTMDRKVKYIGINHLFHKFDGPELEDFKAFLSGLAAVSADALPWETDSAALEAKSAYFLSEMESSIEAYAEFIGGLYIDSLTGP